MIKLAQGNAMLGGSEQKRILKSNWIYGSLENYITSNKEDFWDYHETIKDLIDNIDLSNYNNDDLKKLIDRLEYIKNILILLSNPSKLNINGVSELKHLQKLSLAWYINFLLWSIEKWNDTWFIVIPPWQWKTLLTLLLSSLDNKKTIILTDTNTNKWQFLLDSKKLPWLDWKISEIKTWNNNDSKVLLWWWDSFLSALENWNIDLSQYSTIFIDEADVNWLSTRQQFILNWYSQKYWIKVVWLTATEEQVNKSLTDFYKYEVLRFSIPESLPELFRLWEIPNMTFSDVYIDWELILSKKIGINSSDVQDEDIDKFIKNSNWIDKILDYHFKHNSWKKFIFWMRNNTLNDFIIERALSKWLIIESLDWTMSEEKRLNVIKRLKNWEIDWIIWSRLTWRWLDIPECEVVYNSTLTYSPQIFWQLKWRWFRLDQSNQRKHSKLVTFLPRDVFLEQSNLQTGIKERSNYILPLCFEAFVNPKFFSKESIERRRTWSNNFNLSELKEDQILSIKTILNKLVSSRTHWNFTWKPELLTNIIRHFSWPLTMHSLINYLLKIKWSTVSKYFSEKKRDITEEEDKEFKKLMSIYMPNGFKELTLHDEKELITKYFSVVDVEEKRKVLDELLSYHYSIVIAIAQNISKTSWFDVEDLIQAWLEVIIKRIYNFIPWSRLSWFVAVNALSWMSKYISENHALLRLPVHIWLVISKVKWILFNSEKELSTSEKLDIIEKELSEKTQHDIKLISWVLLNIIDWTNEIFDERIHNNPNSYLNNSQEDLFMDLEFNRIIRWFLLKSLRPSQERIIRMRFWIWWLDRDEMTYEEISKWYWVSRERIRQIIVRSLRKIKDWGRFKVLLSLLKNDN